MAIPKMTLRVQLVNDNKAHIKLIQISDIYRKNISLISSGKFINTKNGWMFMVGENFKINKRSKNIIIPSSYEGSNDETIYFTGDKNRKEILKDINVALIEWSNNSLFKDKKVFNKTPHIRFHNEFWIIF